MTYTSVLTEIRGRVGLITMNRPQAMNAFNTILLSELFDALDAYDRDERVRALVVAGSEKAFAAGADIKEMADASPFEMINSGRVEMFDRIRAIRKPVVAAVSGWALGGGCEFAISCDLIVASETAKFGQPEITIGTMPGVGGTQRLPRAVGKAKAMDWCLTGRMIDAAEAERAGLVARVVPAARLEEDALAVAAKIAGHSLPVVLKIKEAVNRAYESSLAEGLQFERREFHSTFALDDQKEGMRAFVEKRKPAFRHR